MSPKNLIIIDFFKKIPKTPNLMIVKFEKNKLTAQTSEITWNNIKNLSKTQNQKETKVVIKTLNKYFQTKAKLQKILEHKSSNKKRNKKCL